MASDDEDVPDSGAVFTFGRSRFLDNKFWIRDDAVIHLACGDEHSAVVTENGKLYTFGSNDWGQLGHGNTVQFPSPKLVKRLKPEKVKQVAAGRHHTIVSTESGKLYSFGCGSDGQLGHGDCVNLTIPKAIESLPDQQYRMLDGGSDFTAAVTAEGQLYTWGSSAEGQTGQGDDDCEVPTKVQLRGKVVAVACGYYHMAVATDDGTLYMCGENESGKLGLDESQLRDTKRLQKLFINEQVTAVACGGNHTAVVTASGKLFTFGQGDHGELGHGSSWLECPSPKQVTCLRNIHVKFVACGESHTAVITKHGNLYMCGDGRHGKLGMGEESFSNLFKLEKVKRFDDFTVQKAACGGCHTLITAFKTSEIHEGTDSEAEAEKDILAASISSTKSLQDAVDGRSGYMSGLAATVPVGGAARNKRRQRNIENLGNSIGGSLPPINKSTLPPLSRTLPVLKKEPAKEAKIPVNPLDISTLPKILQEDQGIDKRKDEVNKENKSNVKKEAKVTKRIKKPKDAESSSGISESEEEDDEEEQDKKHKDKTAVTKEEQKKADEKSEESMTEDESDSKEEESTGKTKIEELNESGKATATVTSNKDDKKSKVPPKKEEDEEEEEDSGEEEESDDEEDDEESAEEGRKPDKNKQLTVVGKKIDVTKVERKKDENEESEEEESDEDEEEDDDDDEEGEVNKKKKQQKESEKTSEAKEKDKKPDNKKKKETEEEEEEESEEDEEEDEEEEEEEKSEAGEKTKDAEKDKQAKEKTEAKKKKKKTDENEEEEEEDDDSGKKKVGNKKDKKKNKKEKDKVSENEVDDEAEANEDDKTEDDKADKEEETTKDKKDKKEDAAGKPEAGKKEKKSGICVLL